MNVEIRQYLLERVGRSLGAVLETVGNLALLLTGMVAANASKLDGGDQTVFPFESKE